MRAVAVSLIVVLLTGASQAASVRDEARAYRVAHEKQVVADFVTLLAMPNVATSVGDVERNAAYIEGQLQARGFRTRILRAEPGTPPSVFAELESPGARRTVLFYAHYDGQPVSQKGWISDPFKPSMRTPLPQAAPVDWHPERSHHRPPQTVMKLSPQAATQARPVFSHH